MTKKEKLILSILLGWVLIHLVIFCTVFEKPTDCDVIQTKNTFWPIGGGTMKCVYDGSEFLVYTVLPLIVFAAYKLLNLKNNRISKMKNITSNLEFLQSSSEKTCQYLSGKDINIIQLFCLGLLRRIDDTTTTTKVLFELLPKNNKHEFSIGIMFRALVLDTLISMNLYKLIKDLEAENKTSAETEDAVKEFCNTFLSDGLNATLSYIQDAETLGMRTAAETAETFKNMGHVYKPFFDNYPDDGTKPKLKFTKKHTAKQLFEILAKANGLKEVSKIYDSYAYLSKYDHFGIIYYNAINEKLETKIKIYSDASDAFVVHHALVHVILARYSQNDALINEQATIANDYLLNHIINPNNK